MTRVTRVQNALDDVAGNIWQALAKGDRGAEAPAHDGRRAGEAGGRAAHILPAAWSATLWTSFLALCGIL
jgi:hypothetical protein